MARCPSCGGHEAVAVRHVAWGGFLAPWLYGLVRCAACGGRYRGSDGRPEREIVGGYLRGVLAGTALLAVCAAGLLWWAVK